MATKTIKYVPKATSARTEYREVEASDLADIQQQLIRWLAFMSELDMSHDEDMRAVREQFWHRRTKSLPSGKEGMNTPASFIGGIVNNMIFGQQRDLSARQMEGIEYVSKWMAELDPEQSVSYRFQLGF
jgi:hypothetical protein